jgi:transglutaminase-like putative cysteine protease
VTLFSFSQVFDRGGWPGPGLLGMLLAGVIAVGARRLGMGTPWTVIASLVALAWYCAIVFRMDDLFYGLPTPDALAGLGRSITTAYSKSNVDYAPVPIRPGYVILEVIGIWSATTIGEIATFRWRRPLVAVIPVIGLFSLLTIVGTRTGTTVLVLLLLSSLLSYLALESSHRLRSWGSWITSLADRNAETPGEVSSRLARRMGASCIAAALFAPVFLPALGDGLLSWRNNAGIGPGTGPGTGGAEVDLLASLRPRLINQSQSQMFEVKAARADYWRLTSLIRFDGTVWRPLEGQAPASLVGEAIASARPPQLYEPMTQRVTIADLQGDYLPAAGHPDTISLKHDPGGRTSADLTFEAETNTVQVRGGLANGLEYEVTSLIPRPRFIDLVNADVGDLPDLYYDQGLIPISDEVEALLNGWTARFDNPFRKLVALQDNLRLGFEYALDVAPSASTDQLTEFLITTKRGYCQQFAAAFALLARHLGLPTRVSVGFLPGSTNVAEPDRFTIRGTEAHAWPEVFFEGYGWVRFEPTPGNGAAPPGYTSRVIPFSAQNPFSDTGSRAGAGNPGNLAGNQDVPTGGRDRGRAIDTSTDKQRTGPPAWEKAFSRVLTVVLLGVLLFIASVPLLKTLRTSVRYRSATTPSALAAAAFAHFESEAADLVAARAPSESASRFALRVGKMGRIPDPLLMELASIYERATYAREDIDTTMARRARQLALALRKQLWIEAGWWQRAKRVFSPIGLVPRS